MPEGTLEALKWLALILMTLDHINTFLFARTLPGAYEAGRIAMPLFSFVLGYNLARPDAWQNGLYIRTMKRLAVFGVLATPFFIGLANLPGGWRPLNILFTFLVATATIAFVERGGAGPYAAAAAVFVAGGAIVEYSWCGPLLCASAWLYSRMPGKPALMLLAAATMLLYVVNQNFWALAALPIILAAPTLHLRMPRIRYAFYIYYPAHLGILYMLD